MRVDLESAAYRADYRIRPLETVVLARRARAEDPLLYFHRGYAEGCARNQSEMRDWYRGALALNPEFSIRWAPVARAALKGS